MTGERPQHIGGRGANRIPPKNYCWIWIAIDRLGHRFIHAVTGSRGTQTGEKLWNGIDNSSTIELIAIDYWKAYEAFVPQEKHIQSKAETFTVEGYNSLFRHFLARLRRKSKCYSKSETMLRYSVMLLMAKRNGELINILI